MSKKLIDLELLTEYDLKLKEYIKEQTYITNKVDFMQIASDVTTATTISNVYYSFNLRDTDLFIKFEDSPKTILNEFKGQITVGNNPITVTFPIGINWRTDSKITHTANSLLLPANKIYSYSILNNLGTVWSFERIKLNAPSNLNNDSTVNSSIISWDSVESATGYNVYYKASSAATDYTFLTTTQDTMFDFRSLLPESGAWNFVFVVRAISENESYIESDYSEPLTQRGEIITDNPFA